MQRKKRIRLRWILILVFSVIAIHFTGTQRTSFAQDLAIRPLATAVAPNGVLPTVTVVDDCKDALETANSRLLKSLDALEKAERLLSAKDAEILATQRLIDLYKQAIEVKDLIIKFQDEAIKKMSRKGFMTKLKDALGIATKIALIASGILIGRGL